MCLLFLISGVTLFEGVVVAEQYDLSNGANIRALYIPDVPSSEAAVRDMLFLANVGKDDVVYDLGSGDGRVVIAAVQDFGCRRAVGIENNPKHIQESRLNAEKAGVADRVEFFEQDLFSSDFHDATVVVLYLGHDANIKLRPKLVSTLKPGTRIVSNQFAMGEWPPDKELTVRTKILGMYGFGSLTPWGVTNPHVPDYDTKEEPYFNGAKVFMWHVPAPVAGVWHGQIITEKGTQDLKLVLCQRLSSIEGARFELSGTKAIEGYAQVDLSGDHLRFWCSDRHPDRDITISFDGRADGDILRGTFGAWTDLGQYKAEAWEMRRDKVDLTGTWDWPARTGAARIEIQQHDGGLVCSYRNNGQILPVVDFYSFGGGFYFTALLSNGGGEPKPFDAGWLIGEAVLDGTQLKGKLSYHLAADMRLQPPVEYRDLRQSWWPERVAP